MITSPTKYVSMDLLVECRFNYDEPSIITKVQDYSCRVLISEPRNRYQLMIVTATKQESINWYFRRIPDISQEDGVGIEEENLQKFLKEMINPTYEINPKNLTSILREAIK